MRIAASPRGALRRAVAACLLLPALVAGCVQPGTPQSAAALDQSNDPLEPLNRQIFDFNDLVDRVLLKPVAQVYIAVLPEDGREAIRRLLDNMKEPTLFFNNVLQGEFERAGITVGRFAVNTTVGLAGLVDVANQVGLPRQDADFGQTLFVWGLPEGPYLILPILGPSNPRDVIGMGVDSYADPLRLISRLRGIEEISIARFAADGVDQRARVIDVLDELKKNSLDYYAQLRSLAQQRRAAELRRGAPPPPAADFYQDPDEPMPGTAGQTSQGPVASVGPAPSPPHEGPRRSARP